MENLIRRGFAATDLELHCLPMSHKKNARFIWIKMTERMTEEMNQIKFRIKLSLYYFTQETHDQSLKCGEELQNQCLF